jgi:hypothetical protein
VRAGVVIPPDYSPPSLGATAARPAKMTVARNCIAQESREYDSRAWSRFDEAAGIRVPMGSE